MSSWSLSRAALVKDLQVEPLSNLFHWVYEREQIRIRREVLETSPPWTTDPILASYRFCNVRREDDRVTRWIHNHIRLPFSTHPHLTTMLAMGRFINLPETLQALINSDAWPREYYDPKKLYDVLQSRKINQQRVYNGAYIISPAGNTDKSWYVAYRCVAAVGCGVGKDALAALFETQPTMEKTYLHLRRLDGFGEFMAYQVLVDMRHTPLLSGAPDARTFVAFGPGTRRGLNRLFGRPLSLKVERARLQMEAELVLELIKSHVEVELDLEMSDIANIMCETDKFNRGDPKQRFDPYARSRCT